MKAKRIALLCLTIATTWLLVFVSNYIDAASPLPTWSSNAAIHHHTYYQLVTAILAIIILLVLFLSRRATFAQYARFGNTAAPALPNALFGIKATDSWRVVGRNFAVIITLVTACVIWIPSYGEARFTWLLLWVLPLAAVNAAAEEAITRFSIVVIFDGVVKPNTIAFISAVLFGTVHYFGTPGGIVGMILAGILGWFLAKSVIETKGVFWAWFIHFLQDIVIIGTMIALAAN